jgi:hypothetical protein
MILMWTRVGQMIARRRRTAVGCAASLLGGDPLLHRSMSYGCGREK